MGVRRTTIWLSSCALLIAGCNDMLGIHEPAAALLQQDAGRVADETNPRPEPDQRPQNAVDGAVDADEEDAGDDH